MTDVAILAVGTVAILLMMVIFGFLIERGFGDLVHGVIETWGFKLPFARGDDEGRRGRGRKRFLPGRQRDPGEGRSLVQQLGRALVLLALLVCELLGSEYALGSIWVGLGLWVLIAIVVLAQ